MNLSPSVALVIAIAIGLPVLACLAIILFTPGVNMILLTQSIEATAILVFAVAAIFEIRRLVDLG